MSPEWISFDGYQSIQNIALKMVELAHRSARIISADLEPRIYDNPAFAEAIQKLVSEKRHCSVDVLVRDTDPIIKNGYRLLELLRRLSSRIKLRRLNDDHSEYDQAIVIVDTRSVVRRSSAGHFEGEYCLNAPREARKLNHAFQEMWETAEPEREFNRLHI